MCTRSLDTKSQICSEISAHDIRSGMTDGSFSVVLGHGGLLWVIMSVADSVGPFVYQDSGKILETDVLRWVYFAFYLCCPSLISCPLKH